MKNIIPILAIALGLFGSNSISAQCQFDSHSTSINDAWLSCETSTNPNPERGDGHWIMYDLGSPKALFQSHIWNYNVPGSTGMGVRNCYFDYSINAQDWESWGTIEIAEAPGNNSYQGVDGPYLDGIIARYLLISISSNWDNDDCSGFAELRVDYEDTATELAEVSPIAFDLFPVPADQQLVLRHYESGSMLMQVFDQSGALVYTQRSSSSSSYLDVSTFTAGLYVMRLSNDQGVTHSKRFMVIH